MMMIDLVLPDTDLFVLMYCVCVRVLMRLLCVCSCAHCVRAHVPTMCVLMCPVPTALQCATAPPGHTLKRFILSLASNGLGRP